MRDKRTAPLADESGVSLILFAITAVSMIGCIPLAIDVGSAYWQQRKLHIATDAGALAGALRIIKGDNTTQIQAEANAIAMVNSPSAVLDTIQVGRYVGGTFTDGGSPPNAVRVTGGVSVPARFAEIFGFTSLLPRVESIAIAGPADRVQCMLPFAVDDGVIAGKTVGSVIDVSRESPGNWGKIDLGGNMSCGQCFIDAMTNGVCARSLNVGDQVSPGTGYGGVVNGFRGRMDVNPIAILPVVNGFPNGNSAMSTVQGFVVVEIVGQMGHGANWNGRLRFLGSLAGTGVATSTIPGPEALNRALVR